MIKLFREAEMGGSVSGGYDSQPTDSGGQIPEDVRKKIAAYAKEKWQTGYFSSKKEIEVDVIHGYRISLPTIQAQEERIRVLEEGLGLLITDYEYLTSRTYPKKERAEYFTCRNRAAKALTPKTNNL